MSQTFTAAQTAIVESTYKKVSWLFRVIDSDGDIYNWSTKEITSGGTGIVWADDLLWGGGVHWRKDDDINYTFKVVGFSGISLSRGESGGNWIGPSDFEFSVLNTGGLMTASDFDGASVLVSLRISDGTNEEVIRRWSFVISTAEPQEGVITLGCMDVLSSCINGYFPNTPMIRDLWPSNDVDPDDGGCVPIPYGTVYIPIRSVYIPGSVSRSAITLSTTATADGVYCTFNDSASGFGSFVANRLIVVSGFTDAANNGTFTVLSKTNAALSVAHDAGLTTEAAGDAVTITQGLRKYLLGPSSKTYTLTKVRAPLESGVPDKEWLSTSYTFTQTTDTGYRLFEPVIVDKNNDGTAETVGFWKNGQVFLDMPTKFSRSDTSSYTNPARVTWHVLNGFGIASSSLDDRCFLNSHATFAGWGLDWNGGYWFVRGRDVVAAELLRQCHSVFLLGECIELKVRVKSSQATIDKTNVVRDSDRGYSTFRYRRVWKANPSDSGYVAWQRSGEPQDRLSQVIVPAKGTTTDVLDGDVIGLPFVTDSQEAKTLGTLNLQRSLEKVADVTWSGKSSLLKIDPDDVVTINHADYGGTYAVVVDTVKISKDLRIEFAASKLSIALDDWADLAPAAVTLGTDDTTDAANTTVTGSPETTTPVAEFIKTGYVIVGPTATSSDFTDLQKAVNALADRAANGIFIRNGTYQLTDVIYLPNRDIEIVGESAGGVVLKNKTDNYAFVIKDRTTKFVISYLTLRSQNTAAKETIYVYGTVRANNTAIVTCDHLAFENWDNGTVAGTGDTAVYAYLGAGAVVVSNCSVDGGKYGFRANDYGKFSVVDCDIENCITYGIYTTDVDFTEISRNTFNDVWEMSIYHEKSVASDAKAAITNNKIVMSAGKSVLTAGIRTYQCNLLTIADNVIQYSDQLGQNYARYGIRSSSCTRAVYKGNTIDLDSDSTDVMYAMRLSSSNNCVVTSNAIKYSIPDGTGYGIYLNSGDRNVIDGNNITGDGTGVGIYLDANSNNNQGTNNLTYNVGTSVDDDEGVTNTVTAKAA